jgi:hypothetical protein
VEGRCQLGWLKDENQISYYILVFKDNKESNKTILYPTRHPIAL